MALPAPEDGGFPFDVPVIRSLRRLNVDAAVTFFVGENGSGKSTLLEGIAAAAKLPAIGSADLPRDESLEPQRRLGRALRLVWRARPRRGFFLRAEDFFGFQKRVARERAELLREIADTDASYRGSDRSELARRLATMPQKTSVRELERRHGEDPDALSHGQSFLRLFRARFIPGGLYLLDEPEAALSPQSQLALLAMMMDMVRQTAQFIIATHSPILLAYPGARILSFDDAPPKRVEYDSLPHVVLTREFLAAPERYFRALDREQ